MSHTPIFQPADLLLPADACRNSSWSVIACDQYTSQQDYWNRVREQVGDQKSTLHLIYPEIYLNEEGLDENRIQTIHETMDAYLRENVFEEYPDSFVLCERTTPAGTRIGLVGAVDLESYDFDPRKKAWIRATEQTVPERIPPRQKVREGASLESPHAMLLIDDPARQLIEPLYERRDSLPQLYDIELMENGGHLRGYLISGLQARELSEKLYAYEEDSDGFFSVVGDGNHSLATAKACWEGIREGLSEQEAQDHPARYALAELVNLHSPAIQFEPIHRLVLFADLDALLDTFARYLEEQGMDLVEGEEMIFFQNGKQAGVSIEGRADHLPLEILQKFLDLCKEENPEISIDYIHGKQDLEEVAAETGGIGILLQPIDKESLFAAVEAGGVLPRKTFSIGEAFEKRYYMECRKLCR